MRRLTKTQVEKARIMKAARSAIRLKHSLAADAEINEKLPELEDRLDKAIQRGESLELTISSAEVEV